MQELDSEVLRFRLSDGSRGLPYYEAIVEAVGSASDIKFAPEKAAGGSNVKESSVAAVTVVGQVGGVVTRNIIPAFL